LQPQVNCVHPYSAINTKYREKVGLLPGDMFKIISESEAMNLRTNTTFNFMLENIGTPWIGFIIHSDAG